MSLYRKYRPQKFEDLIGQDHVAKTLARAVKEDKVVHSYLFSGPRGTGKTTVARILAKAVNCEAKEGEKPCGKCVACRTIAAGKSIDILEIDAASNRGIDEIRELRDKVRFAPTVNRYKVYIIDEVHMLTKEAFNALLKTLEEPPSHAIFILATTESHKVLPTIISRCQRYDFRRATLRSALELVEKVARAEKISADREALALIARAADGAYRDSLTLLGQIAADYEGSITVEDVRAKLGLIADPLIWQLIGQLLAYDKQAALTTLNKLSDQGIDWKYLTTNLLERCRQLLFYIIAPRAVAADLTDEDVKRLAKLASLTEENEIVALINILLRAERELKTATLPDVPIVAAMVEFLNRGDSKINSKSEIRPSTCAQDALSLPNGRNPKQISNLQPKDGPPRAEKIEIKNEPPVSKSPTPHTPHPTSDESTALDQAKWQEIVSQVKEKNTTLAGLLNQSHAILSGDELVIEVPYPFWEEKVKAAKSAQLIGEAAGQALEKKVKISARANGKMREKYKTNATEQEKRVKEEAQEIFG